jgi:hypothetical protein
VSLGPRRRRFDGLHDAVDFGWIAGGKLAVDGTRSDEFAGSHGVDFLVGVQFKGLHFTLKMRSTTSLCLLQTLPPDVVTQLAVF